MLLTGLRRWPLIPIFLQVLSEMDVELCQILFPLHLLQWSCDFLYQQWLLSNVDQSCYLWPNPRFVTPYYAITKCCIWLTDTLRVFTCLFMEETSVYSNNIWVSFWRKGQAILNQTSWGQLLPFQYFEKVCED